MSLSRRQFIKSAVAVGVAAALSALPEVSTTANVLPKGNTLLNPDLMAKEALKALNDGFLFTRHMRDIQFAGGMNELPRKLVEWPSTSTS